ncbi:hypothetical protein C8F01DRAFT_1257665 [Mycena amicta]|nr:hypothetical protein C8F01DRAFT_1257665 [Mycena amicta]
MRLLSAPTKQALSDALLLLQTTVRNAETESADAELARMSGELDAMRAQLEQATSEHVKAVKVARATELVSSRLETKLAGAEAKIEYLRKESVYWQDEAKGWKENYTRVEEERRELATELRVVALSRSGADLTESSRKRRREERTVSSRAIGSPAATDPGSPQATRANSRTNNPAPSTKVKRASSCYALHVGHTNIDMAYAVRLSSSS